MKFSVSIISCTAFSLAKRCIESVRHNSIAGEYELILTANGNPVAASYFQDLRRAYSPLPIIVVVNESNLGFIAPNNHALELARGHFFATLNDDTTVLPGWLEALEAPFLSDPKCAVTGAPEGCGTLDDDFYGHMGKRLDYIEGSCLMVRTDLARRYGLFDPALEMAYGEDADLCLRMRSLGYTIHQAATPVLQDHARGATTATMPEARGYMLRNLAVLKTRWAYYLQHRKFEPCTTSPLPGP